MKNKGSTASASRPYDYYNWHSLSTGEKTKQPTFLIFSGAMLEWENVAEEKNVKENKNQPVFLFDRKCRVSKLERLRTSSFIIQISLSRFFLVSPNIRVRLWICWRDFDSRPSQLWTLCVWRHKEEVAERDRRDYFKLQIYQELVA
jgi:hypothetical protein